MLNEEQPCVLCENNEVSGIVDVLRVLYFFCGVEIMTMSSAAFNPISVAM